ncbi:MAG: hypothetical protein Q7S50_00755 [bacterium]|nr:hypothetical protein [bacterium]
MKKVDRWGLDVPTSITVELDTDFSTLFALGLHRMIRVETNPRSRAVHTIELSRVETLACIDPRGRPCKGIDMVRRFNNERSYGERVKKAAGIVLGFKDKFDLRHYTPVDARICRRVPDIVGIFDHLMAKLGIPQRMECNVRFFMDGSLLTSPGGAEQWILYANKTFDKDGYPVYHCGRWPANLVRLKHDYSLVLR